jgi:ATP synthase protein I
MRDEDEEDEGDRATDGPATRSPAESADEIGRQAERRARARREGRRAAWFGLGMFGMVGWSIAIPTLAGVALGLWLDEVAPQDFSWTLALLLAGVVVGVMIAWYWVEREAHDE